MKQNQMILMDSDVDPQEALQAMTGNGGVNAQKQGIEKLLAGYLEQRIIEKIRSGEMGRIDRLWTYGVETTRGANPALIREYCTQVARTAAMLVSLGMAVKSAWTNHGKLERHPHGNRRPPWTTD